MATASEIKIFINKLGGLAVAESNRRIAAGKGFVLPSVCIAQSALETGWGDSGLMTRANAYFGIKAGGSWTGKVYTADTWEVADGAAYNTTANFRAYDSLEESVADYYDLIGNNSRYSKALSYGLNSADWKTPNECITAIWAGGYATDTLYVQKIMNTINARNLAVFDGQIDGVTFIPTTSEGDKVFSSLNGDLVDQYTLSVTDSGRTISNVAAADNIALNWDKAPTFTVGGKYTLVVDMPDFQGDMVDVDIVLARLIGDTATIGDPMQNGESFTVSAGEKVGFYITLHSGDNLRLDQEITVTFKGHILNDGNEISPSALAFFVKIE